MHKLVISDTISDVLEDLVYVLGDHFAVRTCTNRIQLQSLMESFEPELLVLDVTMFGHDVVTFLKSLPGKKPLIIATTLHISDHLIELLDGNGVKWLMTKPLQAETVAKRLLDLEQQLDSEPELRGAVYDALMGVGVKLRYSGFTHLAEGVLFACSKERYAVSAELYPYVGKVCCCSDKAAEKAISRCIHKTYENADKLLWQYLFGKKQCPSNGAFIRRMTQAVVAGKKE